MNLKIERALISVSDKTGVVEFAKFLAAAGVEIISTGGTGKALEQAGVKVTPIREITKNEKDDYFSGRMKTISFQYESALLYDRLNPEHVEQARELGIPKIDMVVCNLYPFESVTADPAVSMETAVENIDIGGPCMVRAAAKNRTGVAIVVEPALYPEIMDEMRGSDGALSMDTRDRLAAMAFERTAAYDTAISMFLAGRFSRFKHRRLNYVLGEPLGRYAENWHQKGMLYRDPECPVPNVPNARQVHGGALGYNNYLDAEAALASVLEFKGGDPAVSIIKHSNPCGLATGFTTREAMERAWQGDPVSAFGSVIALTHNLDIDTAKFIEDRFVEVIAAPAIEADALAYIRGLGDKKKNLRLLEYGNTGAGGANPPRLRAVIGGLLEQDSDDLYYLCDTADGLFEPVRKIQCPNSKADRPVGAATKLKFNPERGGLIDFALRHCKHVKSNAIVIAREYADGCYQALGMGCGQPNRKDSVMLCAMRAVDNLRTEFLSKEAPAAKDRDAHLAALDAAAREKYLAGEDAYVAGQLQSDAVVLASDAFFPFRDGLDNAAATQVKHIVQPGGSVRDDEVIAAADEQGIAMVFTGVRKFNH